MKRPAIDKLIYKTLFPRPQPTDPHNFHDFLERCLVLEVRQEVHSFYGHLDTHEAKYPGLDYSHPTHRTRLSRWPWHRRLFRAFDSLGLTRAEIAHLTKWEGTKWAKERFEKEQNITIRDTAADGMPDYRASRSSTTAKRRDQGGFMDSKAQQPAHCGNFGDSERNRATSSSARMFFPEPPLWQGQTASMRGGMRSEHQEAMSIAEMVRADDNDVTVDQSFGLQLNEQLRERVAARNAGDASQSLDEDWEQWLKAAIESGDMRSASWHIRNIIDLPFLHSTVSPEQPQTLLFTGTPRNADPTAPTSAQQDASQGGSDSVPARILEAARLGNWDDVPPFLQNVLRSANQMAEGNAADTASTWRRTYSELRLPGQ